MKSTADELLREVAALRARVEQLEASTSPPAPAAGRTRNRRQMLKLAGATLAGAAAGAAGIAGSATPAFAISGGNMILGGSSNLGSANAANTADAATELQYTGAATPGIGFLSQIGSAFKPSQATFKSALAGWTSVAHSPTGVYGYTNQAGGMGVAAINVAAGPALLAWGFGTYAAQFRVDNAGKAQIYIQPSGNVGAPAPAGHVSGELFVDAAGVLYYFSGGSFKPLAGGQGGLTTMLSAPIRLLESRPAFVDPSPGQTKPGQPIAAGDRWDIQITGQVMGGVSVPAGAKAVVGNVTVTNTAAGGYLTLWPTGAMQPGTSSINFGAGATVANGVTVGLSAAGKMSIYGSASTDIIFDAAGYVL